MLEGGGAAANAEDADLPPVARVARPGRHRQRDVSSAALHVQHQLVSGMRNDEVLDVIEARDGMVIDSGDAVADLEAGLGGGAVGDDLADHGLGDGAADSGIQRGEQHGREHDVRNRSRGHHDGARPHLLLVEGLTRQPQRPHIGGHIVGPLLAVQLHIAAEGNPGELPQRATPVLPGSQRAAEADRKGFDMHAPPAGGEVMAELMNEDQDAQHDHEGHRGANDCGQGFDLSNCIIMYKL